MTSPEIPAELQAAAYEAGQEALREAVIAAGGLEGVFRELREDREHAVQKYGMLLQASTTFEEQKANMVALVERERIGSSLEDRVAAIAAQEDMPLSDALMLYFALGIVKKAGIEEEE